MKFVLVGNERERNRVKDESAVCGPNMLEKVQRHEIISFVSSVQCFSCSKNCDVKFYSHDSNRLYVSFFDTYNYTYD